MQPLITSGSHWQGQVFTLNNGTSTVAHLPCTQLKVLQQMLLVEPGVVQQNNAIIVSRQMLRWLFTSRCMLLVYGLDNYL